MLLTTVHHRVYDGRMQADNYEVRWHSRVEFAVLISSEDEKTLQALCRRPRDISAVDIDIAGPSETLWHHDQNNINVIVSIRMLAIACASTPDPDIWPAGVHQCVVQCPMPLSLMSKSHSSFKQYDTSYISTMNNFYLKMYQNAFRGRFLPGPAEGASQTR